MSELPTLTFTDTNQSNKTFDNVVDAERMADGRFRLVTEDAHGDRGEVELPIGYSLISMSIDTDD